MKEAPKSRAKRGDANYCISTAVRRKHEDCMEVSLYECVASG